MDRWQARLSRPIIMAEGEKAPERRNLRGLQNGFSTTGVNQPPQNYSEMHFGLKMRNFEHSDQIYGGGAAGCAARPPITGRLNSRARSSIPGVIARAEASCLAGIGMAPRSKGRGEAAIDPSVHHQTLSPAKTPSGWGSFFAGLSPATNQHPRAGKNQSARDVV